MIEISLYDWYFNNPDLHIRKMQEEVRERLKTDESFLEYIIYRQMGYGNRVKLRKITNIHELKNIMICMR